MRFPFAGTLKPLVASGSSNGYDEDDWSDLRSIATQLCKMRGVDPDAPSDVLEAPWLDMDIQADLEASTKPMVVRAPRWVEFGQ